MSARLNIPNDNNDDDAADYTDDDVIGKSSFIVSSDSTLFAVSRRHGSDPSDACGITWS
jgi:hypothetical protein